jgi:hypothetical protein
MSFNDAAFLDAFPQRKRDLYRDLCASVRWFRQCDAHRRVHRCQLTAEHCAFRASDGAGTVVDTSLTEIRLLDFRVENRGSGLETAGANVTHPTRQVQ